MKKRVTRRKNEERSSFLCDDIIGCYVVARELGEIIKWNLCEEIGVTMMRSYSNYKLVFN